MVKITKEFAVNIGFKTLGHYNAFASEYPELSRPIKKYFEEGFIDSAKKSYTVLAEAGFDPVHYVAKVLISEKSMFQELRKSIPIKTVKIEETGSETSCSDGITESPILLQEKEKIEELETQIESMSSEFASLQKMKLDLDTREKIIIEKEYALKRVEAEKTTLAKRHMDLDERELVIKEREKQLFEKEKKLGMIKQEYLVQTKDYEAKLAAEKHIRKRVAEQLSRALLDLAQQQRENGRLREIIGIHEKSDRDLEQLFKRKRIQ